jgi:hypothetical protein
MLGYIDLEGGASCSVGRGIEYFKIIFIFYLCRMSVFLENRGR